MIKSVLSDEEWSGFLNRLPVWQPTEEPIILIAPHPDDETLGALNRRYRRAFEPGCSIGALTRHLALICDQVEAMDIAPSAVFIARELM